jgi:BRO family, N-terminal domain
MAQSSRAGESRPSGPAALMDFVIAEGVRHGGTADEPWFVTADVCRVLRIEDLECALGDLPPDCKAVCDIPTPDGPKPMPILTEAGLYSLALESDVAEAVAFAKWLCRDLLPDLLETGDLGEKLEFLSGILGAPFELVEPPPQELPPGDFSAN